MAEFLDVGDATGGEVRRWLGRMVSLLGVVGVVGGLVFAATALRGTVGELGAITATAAVLAVVVMVGGGIEYWGVVVGGDASWSNAFRATPGTAVALRIAGGAVVAAGLVHARTPNSIVGRSLSSAVAAPEPLTGASTRWDPRRVPAAAVGVAVLIGSFWFDGHTVSAGPRVVHAAVNTVHVTAGAVWAGGVFSFAVLVWSRHRRDIPCDAAGLVVRFSTIAAVSLGAVAVAGAVMAVMILDSIGDLTGTVWGRTLLVKTALVGVAAMVGAYNHYRLRPALNDPSLAAQLRATLTAEAVLLVGATIATASLVAAAT